MADINSTLTSDPFSRLRQYKTIYDYENKVIRLGKKDFTLINKIRDNVSSEPWKITMKYQYRPDNISNFHYGTPYLYWIIMGYNFLWHLKDFHTDRIISIPKQDGFISLLI